MQKWEYLQVGCNNDGKVEFALIHKRMKSEMWKPTVFGMKRNEFIDLKSELSLFNLPDDLNILGDEGWEFSTEMSFKSYRIYVFKRPKE